MERFKKLTIREELRPCLVFGLDPAGKRYDKRLNKKAMFHRWIEMNDINSFAGKTIKALVEYEDGTLSLVNYSLVKFSDPQHKEYYFGEEAENGNR